MSSGRASNRRRWHLLLSAALVLAIVPPTQAPSHAVDLVAETTVEICDDPDTCLGLLASELVFSHSGCPGEQCITIINTVNAFRSFDDEYDLYTITQYVGVAVVDAFNQLVAEIDNTLTSPTGTQNTVVQQGSASPETTTCSGQSVEGKTTSSGESIGAGFEGTTPKIGFTYSASSTYTKQFSLICSDLLINLDLPADEPSANWTYTQTIDNSSPVLAWVLVSTNQWAWEVPWGDNGCPGDRAQGIEFETEVVSTGGGVVGKATLATTVAVPAPFGECAIPLPIVSGTDVSTVPVGGIFVIEGTNLLSSDITSVFINGDEISTDVYFPIPDGTNTAIKVIAPATAADGTSLIGANMLIDVVTSGGAGSGGSITIEEPSG